MKEWEDFGKALKAAVKPTENGIHIDNGALQEVEAEAEDIEAQYKHLEKTHWNQDFHHAFKEVFTNEEFKDLADYHEHKWMGSMEQKRGEKEFKELGEALKKNVKVSDVPEHWKQQMGAM